MRYGIRYSELYERTYIVEADSYEAACYKLLDAVGEGRVNPPESCVAVEFEDMKFDSDSIEDEEVEVKEVKR